MTLILMIFFYTGPYGPRNFTTRRCSGWKGNHLDFYRNVSRKVGVDLDYGSHWKNDQEQFRKLLKKLVPSDETNPEIIVKSFFNFLLCEYDMNEQDLIDGIEVFKNDLPDIYFLDGTWNLDYDSASYQTCLLLMFTRIT